MYEEEMLHGADRPINWYPGHMAKAKRALADQLSRVDAVVELCDARIPRASRNPDLEELIRNKTRLLVLGKSDLAEEDKTRAWLAWYRSNGLECMSFDSIRGRAKDVFARVEKMCRPQVEHMAARGVRKTVRVMVIGIPNVGKSTFTNKLNGQNVARTGDRPGVTRTNQWVRITPYLELLDTPGLLWPKLDNQKDARALAYVGTISEQAADSVSLSIHLLEELLADKPDAVAARFHIKDASLRGPALLEEACRGRGWILPGAVPDIERGASVILDEFRAGKLGRITLQNAPAPKPPVPVQEEAR